jgi:hypothetical protein
MRVTDTRHRRVMNTRRRRRVTCVGTSFVSRVSCLVSRVVVASVRGVVVALD